MKKVYMTPAIMIRDIDEVMEMAISDDYWKDDIDPDNDEGSDDEARNKKNLWDEPAEN